MENYNHLQKFNFIINAFITLVQAILLGLYVNLFNNQIVETKDVVKTIYNLGNWNFIIIGITFFIYLQIKISSKEIKTIQSIKRKVVERILESACKSLIYPENTKHIRAIITICNYKTKKRETVYAYNVLADPERTAIYDIDFGITGEAFLKRIPVSKELPSNHIKDYKEEDQTMVAKELRSVLAAPIFANNNSRIVIAVLAFDSFESMESVKFNSRESMQIAQSWADTLSEILCI